MCSERMRARFVRTVAVNRCSERCTRWEENSGAWQVQCVPLVSKKCLTETNMLTYVHHAWFLKIRDPWRLLHSCADVSFCQMSSQVVMYRSRFLWSRIHKRTLNLKTFWTKLYTQTSFEFENIWMSRAVPWTWCFPLSVHKQTLNLETFEHREQFLETQTFPPPWQENTRQKEVLTAKGHHQGKGSMAVDVIGSGCLATQLGWLSIDTQAVYCCW